MKQIAVDIGNSLVKFHVADLAERNRDDRSKQTFNVGPFTVPDLLLDEAAVDWQICSVNRKTEHWLRDWILQNRPADAVRVLTNEHFPIVLEVDYPSRVGTDRVAAATAANRLKANEHAAIVIDFGTATTVDAISTSGHFLGGAILPGLMISFEQLATKTDALPYVPWSETGQPPDVLGRSTEDAILAGVYWSQVGAGRELANRMSERLGGTVEVFVTGGIGQRLFSHFPRDWKWEPDLVCEGILIACETIEDAMDQQP